MIHYSLSVDFDLEVLVKSHKAYEAVAAEDHHDGHVSGALQPLLKVLVRTGRRGGVHTTAGKAVEVSE
jgi:hypothetical protein